MSLNKIANSTGSVFPATYINPSIGSLTANGLVSATVVGVRQNSYMYRIEGVNQTIANNTSTILTHSINNFSSSDIIYNAGVYTVNKAGMYTCGTGVTFTPFNSAVARVAIWVSINGNVSTTRKGLQSGSGNSAEVSTDCQVVLSAGDTITFYVLQNTGAPLDMQNSQVNGYTYVQFSGST